MGLQKNFGRKYGGLKYFQKKHGGPKNTHKKVWGSEKLKVVKMTKLTF